MRKSTFKMQATDLLGPSRLRTALLIACISFGGLHGGNPLEGIQERSVVKVLFKHESAGILYEGKFIPEARILEVHEFIGLVFDSRGFILTYVGTQWPKMRLPGTRFLVELEGGKRFSATLVGLDERISLAVLQSGAATNREAVLGHSLRQGRLRFVATDGQGWGASTLHVVRVSDHPLLPEKELRTCGHESESREFASPGSLVFDPGGRFVGIVTDAGKSVFEKKIRSYRIAPIQVLQRSASGIIQKGDQRRGGWLGVLLDPEADGIRIHSVIAESPAAAAGLLPGDVITRVNDVKLQDKAVFARSLQWAGADKRVRLTIDRNGRRETILPTLGRRPLDDGQQMAWTIQLPKLWGPTGSAADQEEVKLYPVPLPSVLALGFVTESLTPQLAKYFKGPETGGLLVRSVQQGTPAARFGFQAGDILLRINDTDLMTPADIATSLKYAHDGVLRIRFLRDGKMMAARVLLN